jgi:hypothetical protein
LKFNFYYRRRNVMKLAIRASVAALLLLMSFAFVLGQNENKRADKDDRNTAPTMGTGGPIGGPTGLFTVYDSQTLRKGEYTLSAAYSNFDRDPGDADITSVPFSFQIAITNNLEWFFGTEAWRGIKINSPNNLSSFRLPNSTITFNGIRTTGPAIILAPRGAGAATITGGIFRPAGAPNGSFGTTGFVGTSLGTLGFNAPFFSGTPFGQGSVNASISTPVTGGAADLFPGLGSPFGSILPGVVFSTVTIGNAAGVGNSGTSPLTFSAAPIYLADAPFINRTWATSAFNTIETGFKWRFNSINDAWGHGIVGTWRYYWDHADDAAGWNQLNRGAGTGSNWGDFGVNYFIDGRATKWSNVAFNVGYTWTSKVKGNFNGTDFTILDPGDQLHAAIGVDFPVNKHFQPILEWRYLRYVGGRTPNALEQHPMDGLVGFRVYPARWWGFGLGYRHNFNSQDLDSFGDDSSSFATTRLCAPFAVNCAPATITTTVTGIPQGVQFSSDPHGYFAQFWVGRRNPRAGEIANLPPNVTSVDLSSTTITLPCPPGQTSASGACPDSGRTISVRTTATDPENDVLTYNYTVSGGRVVGTGANVTWDLSGATAGTYTITTGVDDGCGVCGRTDTKTITIRACPDCRTPPPACPSCTSISVDGPSGLVPPGSSVTFTATGGGGGASYNWSVSAGSIASGQGTASITVTAPNTPGATFTATANATWSRPGDCTACNSSDSATAQVTPAPVVPVSEQIDEIGRVTPDELKARLDIFVTRLNADPTARGYIINYGTAAEIRRRRQDITRAASFRGFDMTRITFVDGPNTGAGPVTKLYIVPAGATPPNP